jgi:uncharacterized OB-fold protein
VEPINEQVLERIQDEVVDRDNVDFYRGLLQRELRLCRCGDCGEWHHPPRAFCPECPWVLVAPSTC